MVALDLCRFRVQVLFRSGPGPGLGCLVLSMLERTTLSI